MSSQSSLPQRPSSSRANVSRSDPPDATSEASTPDDDDGDQDDETAGGNLPMSMSASVILTNLPKDASEALSLVDDLDNFKGR